MATYTGDDGNNTYTGTEDADQASGLGGNDILNGMGGNDTLQGGDGDDELNGGDGDDIIYGGSQFAEIFANDDNILNGGAGADRLYGGAGDDQMNGGAGNDLILDGLGGNNTVDGGDGDDEIELGNNLSGPFHINHVAGGNGNDRITLHYSSGSITGGAGSDRISVDRGNVTIDAGADNDEILLGQHVFQTDGVQTATGGSGADLFWITDTSRFGERDVINDFDAAEGDRLQISSIEGGRTNAFWALPSASLAWRGSLNPSLFSLGATLPPGEFGTGFVGIWTAQAGGNTYVIADSNGDLIFDAGDMVVEFAGTVAIDRTSFSIGTFPGIYGTSGNDTLVGTSGNDALYGLGGDDTLSGGPGGFDMLDGGDGNDTLTATQSQQVSIFGGAGNDVITCAAGFLIEGGAGDDIITGSGQQLLGGEGNDIINGNGLLDGGVGDDILRGGEGDDTLEGFAGNDVLRGGGGSNSLQGRDGIDTLDYSDITSGAVTVRLDGGMQNTGAGGFDHIGINNENLIGTLSFGDTLEGSAVANSLSGLGGDDTLLGLAGNDSLDGGSGNDLLVGGRGQDRLAGVAGADIYRFDAVDDSRLTALRSDGKKIMPDQIMDFTPGVDKIDLSAIDANAGTGTNDAFTFIGTGAFTNQAGQLRAVSANGVTSIYADLDGDGLANMHIILATPVTLTASDFIL